MNRAPSQSIIGPHERLISLKSKSVQPALPAKCSIAPATSVPSLKHQVRVERKGVPKRFLGAMAHELLSRSFPRQQVDMGWFQGMYYLNPQSM